MAVRAADVRSCAASLVSATSSSRPPLLSSLPACCTLSIASTAAVLPTGSRPPSHGLFARARGFWSGALMAAETTPPRLASGGGTPPSATLLQKSEKRHSSRVAIVPPPQALSPFPPAKRGEGWSRGAAVVYRAPHSVAQLTRLRPDKSRTSRFRAPGAPCAHPRSRLSSRHLGLRKKRQRIVLR